MKGYQSPFVLKNSTLPCNLICAPMLGCTDYFFRQILSLFSPGLLFCEMLNVESLLANSKKSLEILSYDETMRPIGAQICGRDPKLLTLASKRLEDMGFDHIDVNCGCPSPRIIKEGSGAALLLHPEEIGNIVSTIRSQVKIPISVKIRMGWDENHIFAERLVKIVESAKAEFITIHGRTQKQHYQGKADWEIIQRCKSHAKEIKIIGNGDVWSAEDALDLFSQTGCDGIMLARGLLGKPWILDEIRTFCSEGKIKPKTLNEKIEILKKHLMWIAKRENFQNKILFRAKQTCFWYIQEFIGAKSIRKRIQECSHFDPIIHILNDIV